MIQIQMENELIRRNAELQANLQKKQRQFSQLKEQYLTLKMFSQKMCDNAAEDDRFLQLKLADHIRAHRLSLQNLENLCARLTEQRDQLTLMLSSLKVDSEKQISMLREQLCQQEAIVNGLSKYGGQLQRQLKQLMRVNDHLQQTNFSLTVSIHDSNNQLYKVTAQKEQLHVKINYYQQEIQTILNSVVELQKQLQELRTQGRQTKASFANQLELKEQQLRIALDSAKESREQLDKVTVQALQTQKQSMETKIQNQNLLKQMRAERVRLYQFEAHQKLKVFQQQFFRNRLNKVQRIC